MTAPRICIVSHAGYGALTGSARGHIGGVEHQTSLLAKWLVSRGHSVDFVVWREADDPEPVVDGVRVLATCARDAGVQGLRFFHPRWTMLWRALRRSNADVYYHNTAEYVTGQIALWCAAAGRRFVFSAASQADCDRALPLLPTRRERVLYRWGLRQADAVVVQTAMQQRMLSEGFNRTSRVVPMPCPEPDPQDILYPATGPRERSVFWVGRLSPEKRPELVFDAAAAAPDLQFRIAGQPDGTEYGRTILERMRQHPNVTYLGAVPRSRLSQLYSQAGCLLCTSSIEGFPNTFLEAWSRGLPVVSTWDPDGLIGSQDLGVACGEHPQALTAAIRRMLDSGPDWRRVSEKARTYYLSTHRPDVTLRSLESVLLENVPSRFVRDHVAIA